MKYTREILVKAVASSLSYAGVIRFLGKPWSGGLQNHLVKQIQKFQIDTTHFLGQRANCGKQHRGGPIKMPWPQILVKGHQKRVSSQKLRRAMLEAGIKEECASCNLGPIWNCKRLALQINHINGINTDCRKSNLEFLCPNCHSQTDTFASRNKKSRRPSGGMVDTAVSDTAAKA